MRPQFQPGAEGPTGDPVLFPGGHSALRNLMATLRFRRDPMLLAGTTRQQPVGQQQRLLPGPIRWLGGLGGQ